MEQHPQIDILLATHNGERFVLEQIHSLLEQTYPHWRLIVRDDGSTDNTRTIIGCIKEKYPDKVAVLEDNLANLGACQNFGKLLAHSTADYAMFCDQDDVWLPNKIELTLNKMKSLEERYGYDIPLLVYTDMQVVDEKLNVVSDSYWRYQAFNPKSGTVLNRLLVSNVIIGCTVMVNRKLRELSVPFPNDTLMHDWWAGLVSLSLGKNDFIEQPTVLYRQHALNVVGATWKMNFQSIMLKIRDMKKHREFLLNSQRQAGAFADRYGHLLSETDLEKIRTYAGLSSQNWMKRRYSIIKHGYWWSGLLRNVTMMIII